MLWAKKKIVARIRSAETRRVRIVNAITLLLVLPGSTFVVLGLVAVEFSTHLPDGRPTGNNEVHAVW